MGINYRIIIRKHPNNLNFKEGQPHQGEIKCIHCLTSSSRWDEEVLAAIQGKDK